ncbi:hypothetical protein A4S06_01580 [Erysipelotrichaceae bacterium MTC7]|nr:hypothetical protein A4S06_01580 [Erysipelotrichaceae bacterium MTC7]
MRPEIVLRAGSLAGKILLENGAETYRVEETVTRICEAFQAVEANAFATPTGLFVSFEYEDDTFVKVLRIKQNTMDLERIHLVNDISRKCVLGELDEVQALSALRSAATIEGYKNSLKVLSAGFAAMFFTFLFEGNVFDGVAAVIVGSMVQFIKMKMERLKLNSIVNIIMLSAMLTFFVLFLTYIGFVDHRDIAISGTIMLLVPGVAITNAVRDWISGDYMSGATRAIEAFLIAIGVALGAGLVLSLWMNFVGGGVL